MTTNTGEPLLKIRDVTRRFGSFVAADRVSFGLNTIKLVEFGELIGCRANPGFADRVVGVL